jgi:hypothetical protein
MSDQTPPERASPSIIKWSQAALLLLVAIGFGIHYWRLSQLYVSTDNSYVNANRIEMAAQVSGAGASTPSPINSRWMPPKPSSSSPTHQSPRIRADSR